MVLKLLDKKQLSENKQLCLKTVFEKKQQIKLPKKVQEIFDIFTFYKNFGYFCLVFLFENKKTDLKINTKILYKTFECLQQNINSFIFFLNS